MTMTRSWYELTGCLSLSYSELLRTDYYVFLSSNRPDRRSRPPTRRRYRSFSRVCFPVPPYRYFPRPTPRDSLLHPKCAMRAEDSSYSLFTHFPLTSLTSRSRDKGKDYHLISSGRRTTRLPNRMATATDPVAASPGFVRCRSSLLCLIVAAIAVDSGRRRLVLLSAR